MIAALAIVAIWAFAEGLLFFIVADVPISFVAVRKGWRAGMLCALTAAFAAALGGMAAMAWATGDPEGFRRLLISLPAIDAAMVDAAGRAWIADGYGAMLAGSFGGTPYKLYAVAAAHHPAGGLLSFFAGSFAARLPRFLLVAFAASAISRGFELKLSLRGRIIALGLFWVAFYSWYFWTTPG